jgi:sugar/nucleoside kinase (ribokinase family)
LKQADVVKISDEEVEFLFGLEPETGAAYILEHYGVKLVFVTCGAEGCFFKNAVAQGKVPSLRNIKVIDTTGAGDSFNSGFLYSFLQGYDLEKSCKIGNWVASKSIEGFGMDKFPSLKDLTEFF